MNVGEGNLGTCTFAANKNSVVRLIHYPRLSIRGGGNLDKKHKEKTIARRTGRTTEKVCLRLGASPTAGIGEDQGRGEVQMSTSTYLQSIGSE